MLAVQCSLVMFRNDYLSIHNIPFARAADLKPKEKIAFATNTKTLKEGSPGRYTWTYPQQAVSNMSDHVVYLLGGEQPQREGAPLILYQQLEKTKKLLKIQIFAHLPC